MANNIWFDIIEDMANDLLNTKMDTRDFAILNKAFNDIRKERLKNAGFYEKDHYNKVFDLYADEVSFSL